MYFVLTLFTVPRFTFALAGSTGELKRAYSVLVRHSEAAAGLLLECP